MPLRSPSEFRGVVSPSAVSASVGPELGSESTISSFLRWLSRPGYAVRSAISGEFGDALENSVQFALDFPTGGFLDRRLSLANLANVPHKLGLADEPLVEGGDLTTVRERPEMTDVLKRWGVSPPSSTLGRLAVDVGGGIVTDPFTFMTFGGAGIAKNTLTGTRAVVALGRTQAGREALEAAVPRAVRELSEGGADDLTTYLSRFQGDEAIKAERAVRERAAELVTTESIGKEGLSELLGTEAFAETLEKSFRRSLAERLPTYADRMGDLERSSDEIIKEVMDDLAGRANAASEAADAASFGKLQDQIDSLTEVVENARFDAYRRTTGLQGAKLSEVVAVSPDGPQRVSVEAIRRAGRVELGDFRFSGHVDQTDAGLLRAWEEALEGRKYIYPHNRLRFQIPGTNAWTAVGEDIWGTIRAWSAPGLVRRALRSEAGQRIAPEVLNKADQGVDSLWHWAKHSLYDKKLFGVVPTGLRDVARKLQYGENEDQRVAAELTEKFFGDKVFSHDERRLLGQHMIEASEEYQTLAKAGPVDTSALELRLIEKAKVVLPEKPADQVEESLTAFMTEMRKIPDELVSLDVWKEARGNPFYIPFQASDDLADLMSNGVADKGLRTAIKDVFTNRRKHETYEEFLQTLQKEADRHGYKLDLDNPELSRAVREAGADPVVGATDGLRQLANEDIGRLFFRRLRAHARTRHRAGLVKEARTKFKSLDVDRNMRIDKYVARQLEHLSPRSNVIQKTLARFNQTWKAAVTVALPNVSFQIRNATSAILQAATDPDVGLLEGLKTFGLTFNNGLWAAILPDAVPTGELAKFVKALDPNLSVKARDEIQAAASAVRIGNYTGAEVLGGLKGAVASDYVGAADLMIGAGKIDRLLKHGSKFAPDDLKDIDSFKTAWEVFKAEPKTRNAYNMGRAFFWHNAVEGGSRIARYIEHSFRIGSYLKLVKQGINPTEAGRRVAKAFVNYDINSEAERLLRDIIPFFKFQTAIVPPLAEQIGRRPASVQALSRSMGSLQSQEAENYVFLPEHIRDGLAVKTPFTDAQNNPYYIAGLGIPHEAAANVIGIAPKLLAGDWTGVRRGIVGGLTPMLRLPVEQTMDRSAFFGSEMGSYRRAPAFLPDSMTTKYEIDGREVREIPGWVNDWVVNGGPWSRVAGSANAWMDERRGFMSSVIRVGTGVRAYSVDEEREVRRVLMDYLEDAVRRGQVGEVEAFFARGDEEQLPERLQFALDALQQMRQDRRRRMAELRDTRRAPWLTR